MKIRSMRGEEVDMTLHVAKNEHAIAVGNAKMNARGDVIGRNGQVVKRREVVAQEYHNSNPKAVKKVGLAKFADEMMTPTEAAKKLPPKAAPPKRTLVDND